MFGTSKDWFSLKDTFLAAFGVLYSALKRKPLEKVCSEFAEILDDELSALNKEIATSGGSVVVDYNESFGRIFFMAGLKSLYGPKLTKPQEIWQMFAEFDMAVPKFGMCANLPLPLWLSQRLFASRGLKVREALKDNFEEWLRLDGHKEACDAFHYPCETMRAGGCSDRNLAAVVGLGMLLALQGLLFSATFVTFKVKIHLRKQPTVQRLYFGW